MPGLICTDSRHVDMGTSGRHADKAFISPAANESFALVLRDEKPQWAHDPVGIQ